MAKTGMTTRDFLEAVIAGKGNETAINGVTLRDKAEEMIAALDRKNEARKMATANGERKPSKAYEENAPIREEIKAFFKERMESGNEESEIVKNIASAIGYTVPKTNAAIRQMVEFDKSLERIDLGRNKPLEYRLIG